MSIGSGPGSRRGVVAFTAPAVGHLHRMLPLVEGLCAAGIPVHFFAHRDARETIERTGARYVDLYEGGHPDETDPLSRPPPIRCVSFAGLHGDRVTREAAALRPGLVLHDTHAVIGRVVAYHLGLPRVEARAGDAGGRPHPHPHPGRDCVVSPRCEAAVRLLKERHGMPDASPWSFRSSGGADLTVCSFPPEFCPPGTFAPSEPVEFFGSYWPAGAERPVGRNPADEPFGADSGPLLRVYISFGTVVWDLFERRAMAALEVLVDALGDRPGIRVLVSLGGRDRQGAMARLTRSNIRVEPYVDQIRVLRKASVFVTHHGLNSTHEAISHGVPMISHPFGGDQPGTAARCQELGLAVPLGAGAGEPITVEDVHRALAAMAEGGDALRARLDEARGWEWAVIDRRPDVIRRIARLIA